MRPHLFLIASLAFSCETPNLVSTDDQGSKQADLDVSQCIAQAQQSPADFLDGGVDRLEACLADAGIDLSGFQFDAGLPPGGFSFDAGLPPGGFSFDAGLPPGGFSFDAGLPPGGFSFDAGGLFDFDAGLPAGLLSPCSPGCTCPSGLQCLNPLNQVCPGNLSLCIP
jgi:hypothetical protein